MFLFIMTIATLTVQAQSHQCAAIAKSSGKQCKNMVASGTFCHVHDGKPSTATKSSSGQNATACGAITSKGMPCKRKVQGGGRCFQHK
jgi:hypothetical protein